MSLTLGEKLRQARESRGITISEVAEQTRISSLYLESIENNDYRGLPGGIFNKGFVKSFAKYVGVEEQEALQDYARIVSAQSAEDEDESKSYRPEVLTDDRTGGSFLPTIIFAVIILGLLSWAVISLVNYLNKPADPTAANSAVNSEKTNSNSANSNTANTNTAAQPMPAANEIKIEFKALTEKINVTTIIDGKKASADVLPATSATYTGQQSVTIMYYKGFTPDKIQLTVNGKTVTVPSVPFNPKRNTIEFEINKENLQQIWQSGAITTASPEVNANSAGSR